jgi:hypothetical protein
MSGCEMRCPTASRGTSDAGAINIEPITRAVDHPALPAHTVLGCGMVGSRDC